MNAENAGPFYDLSVRNFVPPSDAEKSAEAAQVELLKCLACKL